MKPTKDSVAPASLPGFVATRRKAGRGAGPTAIFRSSWTTRATAALALAAAVSACTVGPDYRRPSAEVPVAYKEQGPWKPGQPGQAGSGGPWWSAFGDPILDGLERQVEVSNQSIMASEAAYRQAVALAREANAALFPTLALSASGQRAQSAGGSSQGISVKPRIDNQFSTSLGASWDLDVWGRLRRAAESSEASAEASGDDLAAARLTAQAALASDYFALRGADELKALLDRTVIAYTKSLEITRNQYSSGVASKADVAQAETQLKSTQAQAVNVGIQRAQLEHAIAVLIGKPPAEFAVAPVEGLADAPVVPAGVPSTLLERRPDIAAAERRMAAANAQIGVATAAFYPDLTLSASFGFVSTAVDQLFKASHNIWSVGPQLAETLFDGGLRSAQLDQAKAGYDQTVATYRQTVLSAFQQVEDELAAARILADQAIVEQEAVASAQEAERLILNQYKAGTVAYTSVVTAQAAALAARQNALTVRQNRLTASVLLIEALGGGWDVSQGTGPTAQSINEGLEKTSLTTVTHPEGTR